MTDAKLEAIRERDRITHRNYPAQESFVALQKNQTAALQNAHILFHRIPADAKIHFDRHQIRRRLFFIWRENK